MGLNRLQFEQQLYVTKHLRTESKVMDFVNLQRNLPLD